MHEGERGLPENSSVCRNVAECHYRAPVRRHPDFQWDCHRIELAGWLVRKIPRISSSTPPLGSYPRRRSNRITHCSGSIDAFNCQPSYPRRGPCPFLGLAGSPLMAQPIGGRLTAGTTPFAAGASAPMVLRFRARAIRAHEKSIHLPSQLRTGLRPIDRAIPRAHREPLISDTLGCGLMAAAGVNVSAFFFPKEAASRPSILAFQKS